MCASWQAGVTSGPTHGRSDDARARDGLVIVQVGDPDLAMP